MLWGDREWCSCLVCCVSCVASRVGGVCVVCVELCVLG